MALDLEGLLRKTAFHFKHATNTKDLGSAALLRAARELEMIFAFPELESTGVHSKGAEHDVWYLSDLNGEKRVWKRKVSAKAYLYVADIFPRNVVLDENHRLFVIDALAQLEFEE